MSVAKKIQLLLYLIARGFKESFKSCKQISKWLFANSLRIAICKSPIQLVIALYVVGVLLLFTAVFSAFNDLE